MSYSIAKEVQRIGDVLLCLFQSCFILLHMVVNLLKFLLCGTCIMGAACENLIDVPEI